MPAVETIVASLELRFLIDRHLAARRFGQGELANVYAHAAEGLLTTALPGHADAISAVASRKGDGALIGSALAQDLSPASAAAVNVVWLLRGARRPAMDVLSAAFRDDATFHDTIRMLCARIMPTAPSTEVVKAEPIETAAAYRR